MTIDELKTLVAKFPTLQMNDEEVFVVYEHNGTKKASLDVNIILDTDETLVYDVLETLALSSEHARQSDDLAVQQEILKNAQRYWFLRDTLFSLKRGDLPEGLGEYFYNVEDIKYPTAADIDRALDYLIEESKNV